MLKWLRGGMEMKKLDGFVVGAFLLILILGGSLAYADEHSSGEAAGSKWEFNVIPYFWMAGIGGDMTVKGRDAHLDSSFSDIWDDLDFGAQVHMNARKGKWGVFLDVTYLDLSDSGEVIRHPALGSIDGKVDLTEWVIELGGAYQVAKWPLDNQRAVSLDVIGGGRYWELESELTLTVETLDRSFNRSATKQWIDPFVGLVMQADLGRNFLLTLRGDIGGFGVGTDFTWNAMVLLGYRITHGITACVGYRAMNLDYEDGSGDDRMAYDITMQGPIIGMSFSF
jgi:hypothetical protein